MIFFKAAVAGVAEFNVLMAINVLAGQCVAHFKVPTTDLCSEKSFKMVILNCSPFQSVILKVLIRNTKRVEF